jgi:K+-transporting ATPase ATPase C chain
MFTELKTALRPALALTLLFALLLGVAYPLAITGIGQLVWPVQANGSIVRDAGGRVVGSALIGQTFASAGYFHGRPSAAGKGYDALASSGSNFGPASQALHDRVAADLATNRASLGRTVPPDLVTTSASGLDPHISPEAAFLQIDRVATARKTDPAKVRALVSGLVEEPTLGFIGERRINVLALNRALDREMPRR